MTGSCSQCLFAAHAWNAPSELLLCANHPEHPGQLTLVASGEGHREDAGPCCRSFRARRDAGGAAEAAGESDVRHIPLGGGLFAIVDAADFEWLNQYRWRATGGESGYAVSRIGGRKVYMHRLIANPPQGKVVDHANGNRWDNRRDNLRPCTQGQNLANRAKFAGASRFKGVFWDPVRRQWRAAIRCGGERKHLGRYDDEVEAAMAYDHEALTLFGPYAKLNFPGVEARGVAEGNGACTQPGTGPAVRR